MFKSNFTQHFHEKTSISSKKVNRNDALAKLIIAMDDMRVILQKSNDKRVYLYGVKLLIDQIKHYAGEVKDLNSEERALLKEVWRPEIAHHFPLSIRNFFES